MTKLILLVLVLAGCKSEPAKVVDVTTCANLDLVLASAILADAAHPCRARVDAAYGRMMATGMPFSGTIVSTRPRRGAGLFVTCQHCAGPADQALHDPEIEDPVALQARLAGTKLSSGLPTQVYFIHRLFAPLPPATAFDARGQLSQIAPEHDFVIATVSGTPIEVVGQLGAMPTAKVSDAKLELHDPQQLAVAPWAEPRPGTQALVLGFPRDLPGHTFAGELVASVGEVLDDARAKAMMLRADADEAAIPYDPAVELVVAARASNGMSGGGAFDVDGRYLGVAVRGTVAPVDGRYLTRIVRARYVFAQLDAALAQAPAALRDKLVPFVR